MYPFIHLARPLCCLTSLSNVGGHTSFTSFSYKQLVDGAANDKQQATSKQQVQNNKCWKYAHLLLISSQPIQLASYLTLTYSHFPPTQTKSPQTFAFRHIGASQTCQAARGGILCVLWPWMPPATRTKNSFWLPVPFVCLQCLLIFIFVVFLANNVSY